MEQQSWNQRPTLLTPNRALGIIPGPPWDEVLAVAEFLPILTNVAFALPLIHVTSIIAVCVSGLTDTALNKTGTYLSCSLHFRGEDSDVGEPWRQQTIQSYKLLKNRNKIANTY